MFFLFNYEIFQVYKGSRGNTTNIYTSTTQCEKCTLKMPCMFLLLIPFLPDETTVLNLVFVILMSISLLTYAFIHQVFELYRNGIIQSFGQLGCFIFVLLQIIVIILGFIHKSTSWCSHDVCSCSLFILTSQSVPLINTLQFIFQFSTDEQLVLFFLFFSFLFSSSFPSSSSFSFFFLWLL